MQVSSDSSFAEPELDHTQLAPIATYEDDVAMFELWTQVSWMPVTLLPAGEYHWRVRVADTPGGAWSEATQFSITDDYPFAPICTFGVHEPSFGKVPPLRWHDETPENTLDDNGDRFNGH